MIRRAVFLLLGAAIGLTAVAIVRDVFDAEDEPEAKPEAPTTPPEEKE